MKMVFGRWFLMNPNAHSWADSCPLRGRAFGGLRIYSTVALGRAAFQLVSCSPLRLSRTCVFAIKNSRKKLPISDDEVPLKTKGIWRMYSPQFSQTQQSVLERTLEILEEIAELAETMRPALFVRFQGTGKIRQKVLKCAKKSSRI